MHRQRRWRCTELNIDIAITCLRLLHVAARGEFYRARHLITDVWLAHSLYED